MASGLIRCGHCGRANRVPAAGAGTPRCGKCHQPLPWITDAADATFGDIADAAKIPVIVDLWAPWCGRSFGLEYRLIDSKDVNQIRRDLAGPVAVARHDRAPLVVEFATDRLGPHSKGDDTRSDEELADLADRDWARQYELAFPGRRNASAST